MYIEITDRFAYKECKGMSCEDCICNVDNLAMLGDSQKIQSL
jgi:hypothetical protein